MVVALLVVARFNTQPPEGGWVLVGAAVVGSDVSTHSRLKAAGLHFGERVIEVSGFNTQPPEGGWSKYCL